VAVFLTLIFGSTKFLLGLILQSIEFLSFYRIIMNVKDVSFVLLFFYPVI